VTENLRGTTSINGPLGITGAFPQYPELNTTNPAEMKVVSVGLGDLGSATNNLFGSTGSCVWRPRQRDEQSVRIDRELCMSSSAITNLANAAFLGF